MKDNEPVTGSVHWLTEHRHGWACTNPDCEWFMYPWGDQVDAQRVFDEWHQKLSEALASVTHELHWLTLSEDGWECAHPDCGWHLAVACNQNIGQRMFDQDHAKLSEPGVSVPT